MAVVDGEYKFMYADVGSNGRVSDLRVFGQCSTKEALEEGSLDIAYPAQTKRVLLCLLATKLFL